MQRYGKNHTLRYRVFLMIFFWSIFDGILTYMLPILIVDRGFSQGEMGMILGSSSLVGAVFDIIASKYIRAPHFLRLYLSVLILSVSFLGILYVASTMWVFLLALGLWGIYWDLYHFANFDFISRTIPTGEHTSAFGILGVFQALGVLLAPIITGFLIAETISSDPFIFSGAMLVISSIIFVSVYIGSHREKARMVNHNTMPRTWKIEFKIWRVLTKQLAAVLTLTVLIYLTDALFWTIGPLIAENGTFGTYGGLLITAYTLPVLAVGWFVGSISHILGKKRTAVVSFLIGSLILSFFMLAQTPFQMIAIVGAASLFIGISFPALNGAYVDYIAETQEYEQEIQGIIDMFYNVGWMVGPVLVGVLAQVFGNAESFSILGAISALICIFLLFVMPKKIRLTI